MKPLIISLWHFYFIASIAFSGDYAIDKGSVIISGLGNYAQGDGNATLTLMPTVNLFVVPNISIGASLAYTSQSQGDYNLYTSEIGPSIGCFAGDFNSSVFPYAVVGIRYYRLGDNYDSISGTDIVFSGGLIVAVRDHIGISIEAGLHFINLQHEVWGESESESLVTFGFGIAGLLFD